MLGTGIKAFLLRHHITNHAFPHISPCDGACGERTFHLVGIDSWRSLMCLPKSTAGQDALKPGMQCALLSLLWVVAFAAVALLENSAFV